MEAKAHFESKFIHKLSGLTDYISSMLMGVS